MTDTLMLGRRADGRPVHLIRGGSDAGVADPVGAPAATEPPAGSAAATAATGGEPQVTGDGAEEIDFTPESFQALIDKHNALEAERETERKQWEAEREEARKKLHAASQDASRHRQNVRKLTEMLGAEGGKSPAKSATRATENGPDGQRDSGPDPEVARLAAELKATQTRMLASEAQAALLRAEATPRHVERLVRMLELNVEGRDDIAPVAEQIAELKADMPELFTPPATTATAPAGNGAPAGARVIRAASTVAGRGAAGRGAEPPKPLTSVEVLANRALGREDDYRG